MSRRKRIEPEGFQRPHSWIRWGSRLAAAGLAAGGAGAPARAGERIWGTDVAVQAAFHFGDGQPGRFGAAIEMRYLSHERFGWTEGERPWSPRYGVAGRLALVGWDQVQLLVGPYLGASSPDADRALGAQAGIGYRFCAEPSKGSAPPAKLRAEGGVPGRVCPPGVQACSAAPHACFGRAGGPLVEMAALGELSAAESRIAYGSGGDLSFGLGLRMNKHGATDPPVAVPGRPLRRGDGRAPLPGALFFGDAAGADRDRGRARDIWIDRARAEWASVPAFSELAGQLEACGAPAELRDRALAAAEDELTHALMAGRIAVALGAGPLTLGPPARDRRPALPGGDGLQRLANESWLDGCLNEGTAAAVAAAEAQVAGSGTLVSSLRQIAADEQRHADLGWEIVAWAVGAGGPPIRSALAQLARAAGPAATGATDPAGAAASGLQAWGCLAPSSSARLAADHAGSASQRLAAVLAG
jgi:hypothetical protein